MFSTVICCAILAFASAAPEFASSRSYVPVAKSTLTSSSHSVDHGSTHVLHAPVLHSTELHAPVFHSTEYTSYNSYVPLAKSTLTTSSQSVNHGSTHVLHAPVLHSTELHAPVLHSTELHAPVLHSTEVHVPVGYRVPDSAVSHLSSTVHETVPLASFPLYSLHH